VVVKSDNLEEFEKELDALNIVFGAALGAYVGVILAQGDLPTPSMVWLVVLLASLVLFLLEVRSVGRSLYGQSYVGPRWPWNLTLALVTAGGIQIAAHEVGVGQEAFSLIFRGWVIVAGLLLGTGFIRQKINGKPSARRRGGER
jgi:hypothetical protein